ARMNLRGTQAVMSFMSEPDIKDWSSRVAINPARIPPGHPGSPALDDARERLAANVGPALAKLAELVGAP
ncbi:MAG: pyridine nucleotide-disulfide oxidoreductase, partial [Aeromicrobium sp.]